MSTITVVVTRPDSVPFAAAVRKRGISVVEFPLFMIEARLLDSKDSSTLESIGDFDWLVFTSQNGVVHSRDYFPLGFPPSLKIATIGAKTAAVLKSCYNREADLCGRGDSSEEFTQLFLAQVRQGIRVLILAAEKTRGVLPLTWRAQGIAVTVVAVYRQVELPLELERINLIQARNPAQLVWPFFSPSAVRRCFEIADRYQVAIKAGTSLSIGPVTTSALREQGVTNLKELQIHSEEEMIERVVQLDEVHE